MGKPTKSGANRQVYPRQSSSSANSKKTLYWYSRFGRIEVVEQLFTQGKGKGIERPFSETAQVHCRGYSLPLQRIITDFGADVPFGQIPGKLQEHHGISVPVSSAQAITQQHAEQILQTQLDTLKSDIPEADGVACLIVEMDGSMIPIVTTQATALEGEEVDRRTTRQIGWQEARLVFARTPEQEYPVFGATLGTVDEAGEQLLASAIRAGVGQQTYVHGVGDGAPWIADQVAQQFGEPGRYLLDFYHLCDYLADASTVCAPENPKAWLEQQKRRLKHNFVAAVLKALHCNLEPDTVPDKTAPVRAAYRYIHNRLEQLDYKGAITAELPIGSGEIESAHRYVIQQRLKRSGSWWSVENAWAMLALRVLRENQDWQSYWLDLAQKTA
jgi:hypothetical protein